MDKDNPLKILLVEDSEADAQLLLENILLNGIMAFQVNIVQSLKQARSFIRGKAVDALLLDLSLPDSHGLETIQKIKEAGPEIPIVVLTGAEDEKTGIEAVRLGVQDYLVKGQADGRSIARAVLYAVERKQAERALKRSSARFELLAQTGDKLLQAPDPPKIIETLCHQVMAHLDCQVFFNFLVDEHAGKLRLNACAGISDEEVRRIQWLEYGTAVCGCVARDAARIVAEFIPTTPDVRTELIKSYGVKAYASHPILTEGGKVLGTLSFGTRKRETFNDEDLALMKAVTGQVALAMIRLKNEQALRKAHDELEQKVRERTAELQQANRTLRMIGECNQLLVHAIEEVELVREVCRVIHHLGGYRMAWVGYAEEDEARTVHPIAAVGFEEGYLKQVRITWADDEHGQGPTGSCIRTGKPQICQDFLKDPNMAPWREQAVQRGYRSSIALPLQSGGRVFGALMIYADRSSAFDQAQIALLSELADDLAFGIMSLRARIERDHAHLIAEDRAGQLQALATELYRTEQRERRRLAQLLHDHLQQLLVAAKLGLATGEAGRQSAPSNQSIERVTHILDEAIRAARSLTAELSPPALHEKGLGVGLEWLSRRMKEQHGLKVTVRVEANAEPASEQVRILLFEAVRELLFNVVKHAGVEEARVELVRCDTDRVRITVTDQGKGFEPEELDAETQELSHFGLFSIRERLSYLGGNFEMQSTPGCGSCFVLTAPDRLADLSLKKPERAPEVSRFASPSKSDQAAEKTAGPERKIRVLLADDHPVVRQGLALVLQAQSDIEIVGEAGDGEEAVKWVRRLRPDVVLMDITMPRVNGIEATRQITSEFPEICVIGLSMHEKEDMALAMREAGAKAYLAKGGSMEDLIAAVRMCSGSGGDPEEEKSFFDPEKHRIKKT